MRKIMIHLPAYREPELVPTIKNALESAAHQKEYTLVFVDNIMMKMVLIILMSLEQILDSR